MVEVTGFEPATSWSQTKRSAKLSHTSLKFNKNLFYTLKQSKIKKIEKNIIITKTWQG